MSAGSRHRGRHPKDEELFAEDALPRLRSAVSELSWLMERGYAQVSALQLVGDRHELRKRQRDAVLRCACADDARRSRIERRVGVRALAGAEVWIDGFNCLIALEAAMSGGVILVGRDSAHRDLASVHGSYRRVAETERAIGHVARLLCEHRAVAVRWLLDRPVSNSGRLAAMIREAAPPGMGWEVELLYNPDRAFLDMGERVAVTSDAWILDRCRAWLDMPGAVIDRCLQGVWLLDLRGEEAEEAKEGGG